MKKAPENVAGALVARPIAKRLAIGEDIVDAQWIFNDSFLSLTTSGTKLILMDSLCNVFTLHLDSGKLSRYLPLRLKPIQPLMERGKHINYRLRATRTRLNSEGLPMLQKTKHFVTLGSADPKKAVTHLTLVSVDTSLEYVVKFPDLINNEAVTQSFIAKCHLRSGRPYCVVKLLLNVI